MKLIGRPGRESATLPLSISPDGATSTKQKKSKKRLADVKSFSLEEPLQGDGGERTGTLFRSKTYDQPSSLMSFEKDLSTERRRSITSNLPKHNVTFHKLFRDVSEDEELKDSFSCALQKEVLYQGRLYISPNYLGFYCSMLRKEIKVLIPVTSVILLKKANTALLVPNALSVRTIEGDKYLFGSLRNREICYQAVRSVCTNLQDGSLCNTPLSYCADPGTEQNKVLNSSHSDLEQHQESDSAQNCATGKVAPFQVQTQIRSSPSEVDGIVQSNGKVCQQKETLGNSNRTQWIAPRTVNILLNVYMLLVVILLVSSGYIGLRIMELENQLSVMGAWPKEALNHGSRDT
ncbi:GRAM domain-containing protein 2B-like isoform X2 [Spea bombifrons]|uniref:GRAM domain-containing protein 2B-like isoform X2 n=1 Tax=Spea bombifrons TaxID=233779 RepID=UPI00234921CC|nr:GRAM domain-containing protein 2B-like isoform X2 [Spea bombifrons]